MQCQALTDTPRYLSIGCTSANMAVPKLQVVAGGGARMAQVAVVAGVALGGGGMVAVGDAVAAPAVAVAAHSYLLLRVLQAIVGGCWWFITLACVCSIVISCNNDQFAGTNVNAEVQKQSQTNAS